MPDLGRGSFVDMVDRVANTSFADRPYLIDRYFRFLPADRSLYATRPSRVDAGSEWAYDNRLQETIHVVVADYDHRPRLGHFTAPHWIE
jgi:hypothetical protein